MYRVRYFRKDLEYKPTLHLTWGAAIVFYDQADHYKADVTKVILEKFSLWHFRFEKIYMELIA